jgi:hypothetical protein
MLETIHSQAKILDLKSYMRIFRNGVTMSSRTENNKSGT